MPGCSAAAPFPPARPFPPRVGSRQPRGFPSRPRPGPAAAVRRGALPPRSAGRVPSRASRRGLCPAQPRERGARGRSLPLHPRPAPAARTGAWCRAAASRCLRVCERPPRAGPASRSAHGGAAVPLPREPPLTDLPPLRPRQPSLGPRAAAPLPRNINTGPAGCPRAAGGRWLRPGPRSRRGGGRTARPPFWCADPGNGIARGLPGRAGPAPSAARVPWPQSAANAPCSANAASGSLGLSAKLFVGNHCKFRPRRKRGAPSTRRLLHGYQCSAVHVPEDSSWT